MWQNRTAGRAVALLAVGLGCLGGCRSETEHTQVLGQCDGGTLVVREHVFERRGFSGRKTSTRNSVEYHIADGRRVPVKVSELGSYATAAEDRLAVLREPEDGDWQAYIDPESLDPKSYAALVNCLQADAMEGSRLPAELPFIATVHYDSLDRLRRRYSCGKDARIDVREDGLVYFHADSNVLIGSVLRGGEVLALDGSSLSYLSTRSTGAVRDPVTYLRGCSNAGVTISDQFKMSVLAGGLFWPALQAEWSDRGHVYRAMALARSLSLLTGSASIE